VRKLADKTAEALTILIVIGFLRFLTQYAKGKRLVVAFSRLVRWKCRLAFEEMPSSLLKFNLNVDY
jgi:hypothetical protein